MAHGAGFGAVVVQRHHAFAAIVTVDHAHTVGRAQPLLYRKAAACKHTAKIALRQCKGKAGAHQHSGTGGNGQITAQAGVQVIPGGLLAAAGGQLCLGAQLFDLYRNIHIVFSL